LFINLIFINHNYFFEKSLLYGVPANKMPRHWYYWQYTASQFTRSSLSNCWKIITKNVRLDDTRNIHSRSLMRYTPVLTDLKIKRK